MRKRLKKSNWRFWLLMVLALGVLGLMQKLMPISTGLWIACIVGTILAGVGFWYVSGKSDYPPEGNQNKSANSL